MSNSFNNSTTDNPSMLIYLQTVDSIHRAVEWSIRRNRKFIISSYNLGWQIEVEVTGGDNISTLEKIFNEEEKE